MSTSKRDKLIFPLIYFCLFLLDGQATHLLRLMFGNHTSAKVFFIVLILIYAVDHYPFNYLLFLTIIIGLFYDSYYYGVIGVYMLCLPLTLWLIKTLKQMLPKGIVSIGIITIISITFIELSSYIIRTVFQLTSGSLTTFIANSLGPSLLINLLIVMVICLPLAWFSRRKNELI